MPRILPLLACIALSVGVAEGRTANARIDKVTTPMATLDDVQVRLHWPEGAPQGRLSLQARQLDAEGLGYRFRRLEWQCPLRHREDGSWSCEGPVRSDRGGPVHLALHFGGSGLDARIEKGASRLAVTRRNVRPDLTRIELARVPVLWADALLAKVWPAAGLRSGQLDGGLDVLAGRGDPLRIRGTLALADGALQTRDAATVMEGVNARVRVDYRGQGGRDRLALAGHVGGEALFGETYLALQGAPAQFSLLAQRTPGQGWSLPAFDWRDGAALSANGSLAFARGGTLDEARVSFRNTDAMALRDRYLGGTLGRFGIADAEFEGGLQGELGWQAGRLQRLHLRMDELSMKDPRGRFSLEGLRGDLVLSGAAPMSSRLAWRRAELFGLHFGAADLPFSSRDGVLALARDADIPVFGGVVRLSGLRVIAPREGQGLHVESGLWLEGIDVGEMAAALGLPAFRGELNGEIPRVLYADDVMRFDGGISVGLFDGAVQITGLSMERPFGTAPTLNANVDFNDLDLLRLTEVFGFGSITGRLDGRIHDLRLVDWTPVRFDAELRTDRKPGIRQRISQRAVQNISSVGDASFIGSLQGQLIGLFDDFGYRRIGIRCRLENEVCLMGGLDDANTPGSDSSGFTIVEGSGLPRLTVIGHNRRVDWPTFLERLKAAGSGDVKPVID